MERFPTPVAVKLSVFQAINEYNKENPDQMFPAVAYQVIEDAIGKECKEHADFMNRGRVYE